MRTETPERELDPPDSCEPSPDQEVARLKEDVRALKELLGEAQKHLEEFYLDSSCEPWTQMQVRKLQDRIDAELNG